MGDDDLTGGDGDDTYIYNLGDGNDIITESGYKYGIDKLILGEGILPDEVTVTRDLDDIDDVTLHFKDGGSIKLNEQFKNESEGGVEKIIFADGTVWKDELKLRVLATTQTDGDDTVYGFSGRADTINGGKGNDFLNGLSGDDTYIYNLGDGNDTLLEAYGNGNADKLILGEGILADEVVVTRHNTDQDDVTLTFKDGGSIKLDEQFYASGSGVEQVVFADGTIWTHSDIIAAIDDEAYLNVDGTPDADTLIGTGENERFTGGLGDDKLYGKGGSDIYVYASGDGNDYIEENDNSSASVDVLEFTDLNAQDVQLSRFEDDLFVKVLSTGQTIEVEWQFYANPTYYGLEKIRFADGSEWDRAYIRDNAWFRGTDGDDTITSFNSDDIIFGGKGDDKLYGKGGSDTYIYRLGDGSDFIDDEDASTTATDLLKLDGINSTDVEMSRIGVDAIMKILSTGETITFDEQFYNANHFGIDRIEFADGVVWNRDIILDKSWYRGTDGDDNISTYGTDDVIFGGKGDDKLYGKGGSDTYIYRLGDGSDFIDDEDGSITATDLLKLEGINSTDVEMSRIGVDAMMKIISTGEVITFDEQFYNANHYGIDRIEFADGVVWNRDTILEKSWFRGTDGNDTIAGSAGDDIFVCGKGDDALNGGKGDDLYIWGAGDGNDVITEASGAGADRLKLNGLNAADVSLTQSLSSPRDLIITNKATGESIKLVLSYRENGAGDNEGMNFIEFADGVVWDQDTMRSNAVLRGTEQDDTITGDDHYGERIEGEAGNDTIDGKGGDDTISGGTGNDTLNGGKGNDTLSGGTGDDILNGGEGDDTYIWGAGDGNDTIQESGLVTDIDRLSLKDLLASQIELIRTLDNAKQLQIKITSTGEILTLKDHFAGLQKGISEIVFADNTTWDRERILIETAFKGTDADDNLVGSSVSDALIGGLGNDTLNAGDGDDIYIYNLGDGNDVITDTGYKYGFDKLILGEGILPDEVTFTRNGSDTDDVTLHFKDGGSVKLDERFKSSQETGVEQIIFADGTIWDHAEIQKRYLEGAKTDGDDEIFGTEVLDDVIDGGAGNDTIKALNGNDTLTGGLGDDSLTGGDGNDTYIYNLGDGNDVITESGYKYGSDKLILGEGILASEVTVSRNPNDVDDVTLHFKDGGSIKLNEQFRDENEGGVEQIIFADGTVWDHEFLNNRANSDAKTDGDDVIYGSHSMGDTLHGGLGDDSLNAGDGDDIYIYNLSDGNDIITDTGYKYGFDKLNLGEGILADEVTVTRNPDDIDDVTLHFKDGGSIKLNEQFNTNNETGVEQIIFADGTIWDYEFLNNRANLDAITDGDDVIYGSHSMGDTLQGGLGNDSLTGGDGNDTYIYNLGDGQDVITESGYKYGSDKLILGEGILANEVTVTRDPNDVDDVTLHFKDGGSIKLNEQFRDENEGGVEQIIFADGTIWDHEFLNNRANSDAITDGDDVIYGSHSMGDTLQGGLGNDSLTGGDGNDTYIYNLGDGQDVITESGYKYGSDKLILGEGILADEVTVTRNPDDIDDVVLHFKDGGSVTLNEQFDTNNEAGVEQIIFADGTVWEDELKIMALASTQTDGNDTVYGFHNRADTITGGKGNDYLNGLSGDDTYFYNLGDGNDVLFERYRHGNADKLILGEGILVNEVTVVRHKSDTNDFTLMFKDGGSIKLDDQFYSTGSGVEQVVFADGTIWTESDIVAVVDEDASLIINGTSENDVLNGSSDNETVTGGLGDDKLYGKGGSDTYIYASGDGNDYIEENDNSSASVDVLQFTDLNAQDVQLSRFEDDLFVKVLSTGQTIEVEWQFYTNPTYYGLEKIKFADGSEWGRAYIRENAWFRGTDGDDQITAQSSDDTLDSGAGNDWLAGEEGSDTYIYATGYGNDFINEKSADQNGFDTLKLVGLNTSDVRFERPFGDLSDVIVRILSTGETMTLDNQFDKEDGVERIEFADGTVWGGNDWSLDDFLKSQVKIYGTDQNNTLNGSDDADTFVAGDGDDTLYGKKGDDTLLGEAGNDTLNGGAGNDTFVFTGASFGKDVINDFEAGVVSEDVIQFDASIFADFNAVINEASDVGSDTVITLDDDNSVTLKGVSLADLHSDDFQFV